MKDKHKKEVDTERQEAEKQFNKDQEIIKEAKKHLTKKQIEYLDYSFEEFFPSYCEIVDKPYGTYQDCNNKDCYEEWVDQRSVGDSGDSFSGEVYIKLSNGKYLKYHYDC